MIGVTPVALFSAAAIVQTLAFESLTSKSMTGGRSPGCSPPTAWSSLTKCIACCVGSTPASKKWYAPRITPADFMPDQFGENCAST